MFHPSQNQQSAKEAVFIKYQEIHFLYIDIKNMLERFDEPRQTEGGEG